MSQGHVSSPSATPDVPAPGGRLPRTGVPSRYGIHLQPDLETGALEGRVSISLEIPVSTERLVLNAVGLVAKVAELDRSLHPVAIAADDAAETLTLTFGSAIPAGTHELELVYSGKLATVPAGLHLQRYLEGGQARVMLATQFEPADARKMCPMWDEPEYRAVFEVTVDVPEAFEALSNMPIAHQQVLPGGLKRVRFEPTPSMPSYLLVLCAGELEWLESRAAGVGVRVLTALGKKALGAYALTVIEGLLPWFNDYFGVPYALPKLDLIAIPGGFEGAMENWGGITFHESALLFDPETSSQSTKEQIFGIVAHEVAHQWFGNLVTMAWWDDLWLNEGFASWMATKATDAFNPEWRLWPRANRSKNAAMASDARRTTHPIHQHVQRPSDAISRFDEISYEKGEAVIRMIEAYLGEDVFRDGIRSYLKAHAFGNSTTSDLWASLAEASGKDVEAIARSWIMQPGFPLVTARLERQDGKSLLAMRQERFTLRFPDAEPLQWKVPMVYSVDSRTEFALLDGPAAVVPIHRPDAICKLNWGDCGYVRVWHQGELGERLREHFAQLPEADRVELLADEWALALARLAPLAEYLQLVDAAREDESLAVWQQILDSLDLLDILLLGHPRRRGFHEAASEVLRPVAQRLGWDDKAGELDVQSLLRGRVIATLGRFGDPAINVEARARFDRFLSDSASLSGNLRPVVFGLVGRTAGKTEYETLLGLARKSDRVEDRTLLYTALARAQSAELANRTLAMTLADEVEPTLAVRLVVHVGAAEHRDLAAEFARAHLDQLQGMCDTLLGTRFLPSIYESYSEEARAAELEAIAEASLPSSALPEVQKAADLIRLNAELKADLMPDIERWISRLVPTA